MGLTLKCFQFVMKDEAGGEVNPFKIAVDKKLYSILRKMRFQCSVVITFTRGVCKLQASHE